MKINKHTINTQSSAGALRTKEKAFVKSVTLKKVNDKNNKPRTAHDKSTSKQVKRKKRPQKQKIKITTRTKISIRKTIALHKARQLKIAMLVDDLRHRAIRFDEATEPFKVDTKNAGKI